MKTTQEERDRFCREAEEIFAGQRPGSTRDLVYDLLGRDPA
jgi:hypothetical protein